MHSFYFFYRLSSYKGKNSKFTFLTDFLCIFFNLVKKQHHKFTRKPGKTSFYRWQLLFYWYFTAICFCRVTFVDKYLICDVLAHLRILCDIPLFWQILIYFLPVSLSLLPVYCDTNSVERKLSEWFAISHFFTCVIHAAGEICILVRTCVCFWCTPV